MNSVDIEYAIKKDVRNNPIVREVDAQQKRTFARTLGVTVLAVGMLLFSAWQHFAVLQHSYEIGAMQQQLALETVLNRRLHLELESLRSPARIEKIATEQLHMVPASEKDAVVVERIAASPAAGSHNAIVASVR